MNRHDRAPEDAWTDCAPGTVLQLQHRMKSKRRRKVAQQVAVSVALMGLIVVGAWNMQHAIAPGLSGPGGVPCEFVLLHLDQYAAGELSLDQQSSVGEHLAHCPSCRAKMDAMSRQQASIEVGPTRTARNMAKPSPSALIDADEFGQRYPAYRITFSTDVN